MDYRGHWTTSVDALFTANAFDYDPIDPFCTHFDLEWKIAFPPTHTYSCASIDANVVAVLWVLTRFGRSIIAHFYLQYGGVGPALTTFRSIYIRGRNFVLEIAVIFAFVLSYI